jgi:hypothetical protein
LYKILAEELEAARQHIVDNLGKGFIEPSTAPFASRILMAGKPGGGLHFCIDYRMLNAITWKDCYPIALIDEVLERISHAKIFTSWISARIPPIADGPRVRRIDNIMFSIWQLQYKVMPFGLTNGPAIFQ